MKPTVYIETTVVSYLTAWPTLDVIRQAQQEITRKWWANRLGEFDAVTSQFVIDEASAGDPVAAGERLAALRGIDLLFLSPAVETLADQLLAAGALPVKARLDALHLAAATVHGIEYLLTWNCKHLANATMRLKIEEACRAGGFEPPIICTPQELMGDRDDDGPNRGAGSPSP